MLHDPKTYDPDPFIIDSDRHISTPEHLAQSDPWKVCFGYGLRIFRSLVFLTDTSLYSLIHMSLVVFDISRVVENEQKMTS